MLSLDMASDLGGEDPAPGDQLWMGTVTNGLAIDLIQNQLFNHASDLGTSLARWRRRRDLAVAYDADQTAEFT